MACPINVQKSNANRMKSLTLALPPFLLKKLPQHIHNKETWSAIGDQGMPLRACALSGVCACRSLLDVMLEGRLVFHLGSRWPIASSFSLPLLSKYIHITRHRYQFWECDHEQNIHEPALHGGDSLVGTMKKYILILHFTMVIAQRSLNQVKVNILVKSVINKYSTRIHFRKKKKKSAVLFPAM